MSLGGMGYSAAPRRCVAPLLACGVLGCCSCTSASWHNNKALLLCDAVINWPSVHFWVCVNIKRPLSRGGAPPPNIIFSCWYNFLDWCGIRGCTAAVCGATRRYATQRGGECRLQLERRGAVCKKILSLIFAKFKPPRRACHWLFDTFLPCVYVVRTLF